MTEQAAIRCSTYGELIDALKRRKAELQISDLVLDEIMGICVGHTGKILCGERGFSSVTLQAMLDALALDLIVAPSPAKLKRLDKFDRRDPGRVHPGSRVARSQVERVRPIVLSEWSTRANKLRWKRTTSEQRKAISADLHRAKALKKGIASPDATAA
jgi:hypothetical protein